jgi:hypothetical protein
MSKRTNQDLTQSLYMVRKLNKDGKPSKMFENPRTCGAKTEEEAEVIRARLLSLNPGSKFVIFPPLKDRI